MNTSIINYLSISKLQRYNRWSLDMDHMFIITYHYDFKSTIMCLKLHKTKILNHNHIFRTKHDKEFKAYTYAQKFLQLWLYLTITSLQSKVIAHLKA